MGEFINQASQLVGKAPVTLNTGLVPGAEKKAVADQASIWKKDGINIPANSLENLMNSTDFKSGFADFEKTVEAANAARHFSTDIKSVSQPTTTKLPGFFWGSGSDPNATHDKTTVDIPKGLYENLNLLTVKGNNDATGLVSDVSTLNKPTNFVNHDANAENLGDKDYSIDVNVRKLPNGNEGITSGNIKIGGNNIQINEGSNTLKVDGKDIQPGQEISFPNGARIKRDNETMYAIFMPNGDSVQVLKDEAFGHWNFCGNVNGKEITNQNVMELLSSSYDTPDATKPVDPKPVEPTKPEDKPTPPEQPQISLVTSNKRLGSPVASTLTNAPVDPKTKEGIIVNTGLGLSTNNQLLPTDPAISFRTEKLNNDGSIGTGLSVDTTPARGEAVLQANLNIGNKLFDDKNNPTTNERYGLGLGLGLNLNNPYNTQTSGSLVAKFNDGSQISKDLGVIGQTTGFSNTPYVRAGAFYNNNAFGIPVEDRAKYPNLSIPDVNVNAGVAVNIPLESGRNVTPQFDLELSGNKDNGLNPYANLSYVLDNGDYSAQAGLKFKF
ncbi:MAG: hypothetical protein WCK67_01425 [bacterium]